MKPSLSNLRAALEILERIGQLSGTENVAAIRHDIIEAHRLLTEPTTTRIRRARRAPQLWGDEPTGP